METTMTTRHNWIFGLAGLGLVVSAPVLAAPNYRDDVMIVAKRDRADEVRQEPRDTRRDEGREARRKNVREEPEGYGYGYERRQQRRSGGDDRPRDRR
jgi:hypothetical protein